MIFTFIRNRRARAERYVAAQRKRLARFAGFMIESLEYARDRETDPVAWVRCHNGIFNAMRIASNGGVRPIYRGIIMPEILKNYSGMPVKGVA